MSNCLMCGPAFIGVCIHKPKAEETWEQRRDRLAEEVVSFVSPIARDAARVVYKDGYNQGRADLLEDVKVLERRIEIMISEIKACMDQFPKNGVYPSVVFAEHELTAWRKETEGEK